MIAYAPPLGPPVLAFGARVPARLSECDPQGVVSEALANAVHGAMDRSVYTGSRRFRIITMISAALRGVHINSQLETCVANLVL